MTAPLIFKLSGCAFIILAGIFTGNALNGADKARVERIDALIALLRFFKLQIDYYCVPVREIFARCDTSLLNSFGIKKAPASFDEFTELISANTDADAISILKSFSDELGTGFREEQLRSCEYHINRLTELKIALSNANEKRKKLNRVIPFSAAAAIVILLI